MFAWSFVTLTLRVILRGKSKRASSVVHGLACKKLGIDFELCQAWKNLPIIYRPYWGYINMTRCLCMVALFCRFATCIYHCMPCLWRWQLSRAQGMLTPREPCVEWNRTYHTFHVVNCNVKVGVHVGFFSNHRHGLEIVVLTALMFYFCIIWDCFDYRHKVVKSQEWNNLRGV